MDILQALPVTIQFFTPTLFHRFRPCYTRMKYKLSEKRVQIELPFPINSTDNKELIQSILFSLIKAFRAFKVCTIVSQVFPLDYLGFLPEWLEELSYSNRGDGSELKNDSLIFRNYSTGPKKARKTDVLFLVSSQFS